MRSIKTIIIKSIYIIILLIILFFYTSWNKEVLATSTNKSDTIELESESAILIEQTTGKILFNLLKLLIL